MTSVCLAVDATAAAREKTGIGHYTASMLEALQAQPQTQVLPFTYGLRSTGWLGDGIRPAHLAVPGKLLLWSWHTLRWPSVDRLIPEAQVVFSPNYLVLPTRRPLLVTVHDLYFFEGVSKDYWSGPYLIAHLRKHLARRADRVLADSKATEDRLLERVPELVGRTEVVYPGLRDLYRQPASLREQEAVRTALGLPQTYLLCIGDVSTRKNQGILLEAYRRSRPGELPPLVLCGLREASRENVQQTLTGFGLAPNQILTLPYLEDHPLHAVLSGAHASICPSLDEGFGLTVLESLSLGVPVACSDAGSLPEVSGGLARHFDPRNPEELLEALQDVTGSEDLRRRTRQEGPAWASRFRYQTAAQRVIQLAQELKRAHRA